MTFSSPRINRITETEFLCLCPRGSAFLRFLNNLLKYGGEFYSRGYRTMRDG